MLKVINAKKKNEQKLIKKKANKNAKKKKM